MGTRIITLCTVTLGAGAKARDVEPGSDVTVDDTVAEELLAAGAARLPLKEPGEAKASKAEAKAAAAAEAKAKAEAEAAAAAAAEAEAKAKADAEALAKANGA
jgi:membrane protein involved in colicin uptake